MSAAIRNIRPNKAKKRGGNRADVVQMEAVGEFTDDRTPWGFPEPVRVTVTDFLRVQPRLTQIQPWMFDP